MLNAEHSPSMTLALVLLATPQTAPPASVEMMQIAMTRDGVRLEVDAVPEIGARDVSTAFGVFHSPFDPVAVVLEFPRRTHWLQELNADPSQPLMPRIKLLDADCRIAELLELIPILESRIPEDELAVSSQSRIAEYLAATNALVRWGALLDPLPSRLVRERRVKELWKRTRSADGAWALLIGSRLLAEVAPRHGVGDDQLSLAELKAGMRARSPYLRCIAMQIGGKQAVLEAAHNAELLIASVEDKHVLARDGAAKGAFESWPRDTKNFWVHVLGSGGSSLERVRATRHLAHHLKGKARSVLRSALNWRDHRGSRGARSPDVRRLAQMAARDFGVTAAQLEQERFNARRRGGAVPDRLLSRGIPHSGMSKELEASVTWRAQELSRRP
jgi:hypothetical protein